MHPIHIGATIPEVTHSQASLNGTTLHYVSAGSAGSPVLLIHGFPETWWTFHKVIPLLSKKHRVFAVDLRGFGDSAPVTTESGSTSSSTEMMADLVGLIQHLGVGPVHLTAQDISGPLTYRLANTHPELVRSFAAIETGLPGFGLEQLGDVTHGGAWHIGVLAAPGIPEMLLTGHERAFLADYAFPSLSIVPDAFRPQDIDEFVRTYSRPHGFGGAAGLYRSMLEEGDTLRHLSARKLEMPVLAVAGASGAFTSNTMRQVANDVSATSLEGAGHYLAMEAPEQLAATLLSFYKNIENAG